MGEKKEDESKGDEGQKPIKFKVKEKLDEFKILNKKAEDERNALIRKKIFNFIVFMFAPFCLIIFIIGSYDFFKNIEENKCQMTYMFEYPQYVKVPLDGGISHQFPMYGLYAYAEGKQIEPARNFKFNGIPVLYLPGNAGSYKQVRSFASVALRKWLDNRTPFHFDFFSVDFNEEISGVYGYILHRQSQYLKLVIQKITSLYQEYHHIVIIGHSMGGVVAKSANTDESTVQLIYTLATPHLQPPIITDPELDLFYYYVIRNWTTVSHLDESNPISLVSISGGDRDFIISSKLTRWNHNTIHTSAPSIPTVWASTDHLCIVWCRQLVMTVVRSLFDLVEYKQKTKYYGVTENVTARNTVLDYHFQTRSSGKSFHGAHTQEIQVEKPPKGKWDEVLTHSVCRPSVDTPIYVMFPQITFQQKVSHEVFSSSYKILVTTSNTKSKNWIFGCTNQGVENKVKYCSGLENLSNQTELLPSFHRTRKLVHLDYNRVSKYSHLVVRLSPVKFKTCIDIDVYRIEERSGYLGQTIEDTATSMFYNFTYPTTFNQSKLFAWKLHVKPWMDKSGKQVKCPGHYNSVGIFRHGSFQNHNFFKNESLHIRFADTSATSAHALLYLDKHCRYSVRIQLDFIGTAGQLFRIFIKLLPSYFTSIILMSFFFQESKDWINFHRVLFNNAYYLCIVPGFIVALTIVFLPTDYRYMMTEAEYSAMVPMICYFISYALVLIVSLGYWVLVLSFGNGLHAIVTKFIGKKLGSVPDKVTDLALTFSLEKFPLTVAILIIAVAMSTSGALGLALGFILHILKIFKGYEDVLEDLIRGRIQNVKEGLSPINFHTHCAMLWFVLASVNLPSLLYWINSFRYVEIPNWDLSLYICLMLSPSLGILWQGFVPEFNPIMWSIQRYLCYLMGIVVVVYGTHRIYLISLIVVVVLISLAICQLISRFTEIQPISVNSTPTTTEFNGNLREEFNHSENEPSRNKTEERSKNSNSDVPTSRNLEVKEDCNNSKNVKKGMKNNKEDLEETPSTPISGLSSVSNSEISEDDDSNDSR